MLLEDCDMVLGKTLDGDRTLNGYVYDFRLWSRALCATDVAPGRKVRNYCCGRFPGIEVFDTTARAVLV